MTPFLQNITKLRNESQAQTLLGFLILHEYIEKHGTTPKSIEQVEEFLSLIELVKDKYPKFQVQEDIEFLRDFGTTASGNISPMVLFTSCLYLMMVGFLIWRTSFATSFEGLFVEIPA